MSPPILSTPRSSGNSADGGADVALKKPVGKLTRYTIFVCVAAAFGGLTFGYDIGVSGGVTSNRDFLKMVKRERERERERGKGSKALELPEHCWRRGRTQPLSTSTHLLNRNSSSRGSTAPSTTAP